MRFLVITHVLHKKHWDTYYAYGPYVREMNLWFQYVDEVVVIAPVIEREPDKIDLPYQHTKLRIVSVPELNFTSSRNAINSFFRLPEISWKILKGMRRANHIHLRCPGNMGLLGCIAQVFFPHKKKTAKYAGNWDWSSRQPLTYRIQQIILRNTGITKNMTALVYGEWPDRTKNILPFFTASYSENDKIAVTPRNLNANQPIKLLFAGTLHPGKRPLITLKVMHLLRKMGYDVCLYFYGAGGEELALKNYVEQNNLSSYVFFHGNVDKETLKKAYLESHFLVFASQSEGWPKVVAEAMFWGCLPLTTAVSCVPQMIGNGQRGDIVSPDPADIAEKISFYIEHPEVYYQKSRAAVEWSRQFTLERFEKEIQKVLAS